MKNAFAVSLGALAMTPGATTTTCRNRAAPPRPRATDSSGGPA